MTIDKTKIPYPCTVYEGQGGEFQGYHDCYMFDPDLTFAQTEEVTQVFRNEGLIDKVDWRGNEELWIWLDHKKACPVCGGSDDHNWTECDPMGDHMGENK